MLFFKKTTIRHKYSILATPLLAVLLNLTLLHTSTFAASSASSWFIKTGVISESKVWEKNGVDPDIGVAEAFGAAITEGAGAMSSTWDCGKNASSGDQSALTNFGFLLASGYYNDDAAVKQYFPNSSAKKFMSSAQKVIANTLAAYGGGIDNDNKSRCTYVADRMRDEDLITKSADQERADLADTIASQCGPVWSEDIKLDAAEMSTVYYNLLMGLSSKDWKDTVVKPYEANSGANQCSEILKATKINKLSIAKFKKDLQKLCNSKTAQLKRIDSLNDLQLAKSHSKVEDGAECKAAIDFAVNDTVTEAGDGDGDETTCGSAIAGVGWLVCPLLNFMAILNEQAFGVISDFLQVPPKLLADDGTRTAWESFRNIANIAFVIAFLLIIYSQMTGQGVTNYGIKKLLPKLIIAAILVNVSYFVCQIAVDLSNIIGNSIYAFFKDIPTTVGGTASSDGLSWSKVFGEAFAIAAIVAAAILLAFTLGGAALLAFLLVVVILVARKAILILLIVISPLAFVAFLLPNTNQWFKKWWSLFSRLLMVYPVIGVIFGASFLASRIIAGNGEDKLMQITALGIMAIPLFAVPMALKGAMAATGALGAKLNGGLDKATRAAGGKGKERYKDSSYARGRALRKQGREAYKNEKFASALADKDHSLIGRARRRAALGIAGGRHLPGKLGAAGRYSEERAQASALAASHKAANEAVDHEEALLSEESADDLLTIAKDKSRSAETRAAALRRVAKVGGDQHVQAAYDMLQREGAKTGTDRDASIGDIQQLAADSLISRKPAGVGAATAASMKTGQMADSSGYYGSFKDRIEEGKYGAKDYASMTSDDLVRIAEMAHSGDLTDEHISGIMQAMADIESDDTLKGSMTDERKNLFLQIGARAEPRKISGKKYDLTKI